MWIVVGWAIVIAIFVWLIKINRRERETREYLIKKCDIPQSQLVPFGTTSCLGFNLESKTAIFANWHTYFRPFICKESNGNILFGKSDMCDYSDNEPISNIKEFCISETHGESKDAKRLIVYFHDKPKYSGREGSLEAWAYLPNKDIDKIKKLIESSNLKVSSNPSVIYSISWGD